MEIVSDLHIHGRYSRGCSTSLSIKNLEKYARIKGVNLLGTGDFTHPKWLEEIKQELTEDDGILKTKTGFNFLLQTELSFVYTQDGKGRRVHLVVLSPSLDVVKQINSELLKKGRLDYDGRPIFGISCVEFADMIQSISKEIELIPAHIWTPWFAIFGSKSGFNSVEECFKERSNIIHALETGLSSDPAMNWRLSQLDKYTLMSSSDLHSYWPWRIGREATVFDTDLNYKKIIDAIRTKKGIKYTIETDPSYGKYHFTGHRACDVCLNPKESLKLNNICKKCKKTLTMGVLQRVEELADRPEGYKPKGAIPFKTLIPLSELISVVLGYGIATQKTWTVYNKLINEFESELNILLNVEENKLKSLVGEKLSEVIIKNREGKINIKPGYDGEYGVPVLEKTETQKLPQKTISDF